MREILYQSIFYDVVWCTTGVELFESTVGVNLLGNYLRFCKNRFGLIIFGALESIYYDNIWYFRGDREDF